MLSKKLKYIAAALLVVIIGGAVSIRSISKGHEATAVSTDESIIKKANAAESNIPTCDSKQATSMMKDSIENSAFKNIAKVQLLDWDKLAEVYYDEQSGVRQCIGDVVLNTGNEAIRYTFTRAKSDPSKMLIQVEEIDAKTARAGHNFAEEHAKTPEQQAQDAAQNMRYIDCIDRSTPDCEGWYFHQTQ